MHTYTNSRGFPLGRVAPLNRENILQLTSISDADNRRDLDDNFGKEDDNTENDVDDEWGLFPMI